MSFIVRFLFHWVPEREVFHWMLPVGFIGSTKATPAYRWDFLGLFVILAGVAVLVGAPVFQDQTHKHVLQEFLGDLVEVVHHFLGNH
jgi:hypothetical protein